MTPDWVIDRFQDAYLALPPDRIRDPRFAEDGPAWRLFLRARHYHVLLRTDAAEAEYRKWLARYPDLPQAADVLYNVGLLQFTQRRDPAAAIATFDALLARYRDTPWWNEALYLKARAYEAAGDCRAAAHLYRAVADGDGNGAEDAQARIGRLPCV